MADATSGEPMIFGMQISKLDTIAAAQRVLREQALPGTGARLLVTPNIQHVALMRTDPELRNAMQTADMVICDGFPVFRYAQMRGCPAPARVTGREVVDAVMNGGDLPHFHRLFFVVDGKATRAAVLRWARDRGLADRVEVVIPPMEFDRKAAYCMGLARQIAAFGTTLLLMGTGAPRSELFVARHRYAMGDCWALCVGQGIKMALGLVPQPPATIEALNLEWAWRVALEPRRLARRYVDGATGFLVAVAEDMTRRSHHRA